MRSMGGGGHPNAGTALLIKIEIFTIRQPRCGRNMDPGADHGKSAGIPDLLLLGAIIGNYPVYLL